ncbi:MAG: NlpC/P60 family protein [Alphaproteobacteria bacterium]
MIVNIPYLNVYNDKGKLTTQLIYGEKVEVLGDETNFGTKVKSLWDGYTGFIDTKDLIPDYNQDIKINVLSAPVFQGADLKSPHICNLSLNSQCQSIEISGDFINIGIGWVYNKHTCPVNEVYSFDKIIDLAELFLNVPYVWGGKSSNWIDCSAFIQMIFMACGIDIPRDTSEQCKLNWDKVDISNISKADLVFWDGHIGIMTDDKNIIHANATDMMVKKDSLINVENNIKTKENKDISLILRYKND